MSLYLDYQFLNEISSQLPLFKKLNNNLWNFRCPLCGDSKQVSTKARGYVFNSPDNQNLIFKCHNCGETLTFGHFLKMVDPVTYKRYVFEALKEKGVGFQKKVKEEEPKNQFSFFRAKEDTKTELIVDEKLKPLIRVDLLPDNHPCKQYVLSRQFPEHQIKRLYYTDNFKEYVNSLIPNKFEKNDFVEPRMVIPFMDTHGRVYALQGRSLNPNANLRYFTVKFDPNAPKIFGLDSVDYSKHIYVTEGALDSLFLPNALAVSGSSFESPLIEQIKTNCTLVFDNERRSKEITALMKKMLLKGYRVCLWREGLNFKDINEGILSGLTAEQIRIIIDEDAVQGTAGLVKFALWKK